MDWLECQPWWRPEGRRIGTGLHLVLPERSEIAPEATESRLGEAPGPEGGGRGGGGHSDGLSDGCSGAIQGLPNSAKILGLKVRGGGGSEGVGDGGGGGVHGIPERVKVLREGKVSSGSSNGIGGGGGTICDDFGGGVDGEDKAPEAGVDGGCQGVSTDLRIVILKVVHLEMPNCVGDTYNP